VLVRPALQLLHANRNLLPTPTFGVATGHLHSPATVSTELDTKNSLPIPDNTF
jgi:hypothetical protein